MSLRQALLTRGINVFALDVVVESVQPDEVQGPIDLPGGWRLLAHPETVPEGKDSQAVRDAKWEGFVGEKTKARMVALASADHWPGGMVSWFGFGAEVPPMMPFVHRSGRWFFLPPAGQEAGR